MRKQDLKIKISTNDKEALGFIQEFARKGGSQKDCIRILNELREEFKELEDETLYDLTLDLLDVATSWCSPSDRVWSNHDKP